MVFTGSRGPSEKLRSPSESLDGSPKRSVRDTFVTAGRARPAGEERLCGGLGESTMIGSGEDPDKGCDVDLADRRRLEERDLDNAARVASSPSDVSSFSDEVELGSRRFCLPNFRGAVGLAGLRRFVEP